VKVEGAGKGKIVERGKAVLKQSSGDVSTNEQAAAQGRKHAVRSHHVQAGCIPMWLTVFRAPGIEGSRKSCACSRASAEQ
jgi:hypothetical protein